MITKIFKYKQIFRSIIGFNLIHMMDYFFRFEKSAKLLFCNKPMFKNISFTITKRMIRFINKYISTTFLIASFPLRMFGTFVVSMIRRISYHIFSFLRMVFTKKGIFKSNSFFSYLAHFFLGFLRMLFSKPTFFTFIGKTDFPFSFFSMWFTFKNSAWHNILQIKRVAFRWLTEIRIGISTLLTTQIRQKKIASLLTNISIPFFNLSVNKKLGEDYV